MKKIVVLLLIILSFVSCGGKNPNKSEMTLFREKNGKVKVLSTIAMIGDLVKEIGKEHVDSINLMRGDFDPHSYQLVKGDDEKLFIADLVFYNGLGLEHGPSLQHYLETSAKAIGLGNKVMEKNPEIILKIDGQLDPHIWMDISIWSKIVPFIVEALVKQDPQNASYYDENGKDLLQRMEAENKAVTELLQSIPENKRYLVTSHDAFNYFAKSYLATDQERKDNTWQDRFAAPEGLAPESQLSATHIQQIIDYLAKYQVTVLFPESNISKDSLRKILSAGKEKGLDILVAPCCLYADAMGEPGSEADTYLKMVRHNAEWIKKHISQGN